MKDIRHIAIIMDGNRRWAVERGLPKIVGHTYGAKNIRRITEAALRTGIPYLTLFVLSTENLKNRSEKELAHIFLLLEKLMDNLKLFEENDVRFKTIGDASRLPDRVRQILLELKRKTADHKGLTLTVAINYGGRDEILRAINTLLEKEPTGHILDESSFSAYLDTAGMPDVDLLIRTAGYQRISNFLPWQSVYAELYFTDVKWPAFSENDLTEALGWFSEQQRNRGK